MSWLEASAYGPPERANGMRLPPTMAARRGSVSVVGTRGSLLDVNVHLRRYPGTVPRMSDRYQQFAGSRPGRRVVRRLGLPGPVELRRHAPGAPGAGGARAALRGRPAAGSARPPRACSAAVGAETWVADQHARAAAKAAGLRARDRADEDDPLGAVVLDATGIARSEDLRAAYELVHPHIRQLAPSGRLVCWGRRPTRRPDAREAVAQRALEGFVRSAAKELKRRRDGAAAPRRARRRGRDRGRRCASCSPAARRTCRAR